MTVKYNGFLNGNILKIIAAVFMVIDHVGVTFYPILPEGLYLAMRAIGRITMPIFAYFIAEGCRYTKNRKNYFLTMFALSVVCFAVYYLAMGQIYFTILTTFSLSILLIYAYDSLIKSLKLRMGEGFMRFVILVALLAGVYMLDLIVTKKGGVLDYGFAGAILPLLVYIFKNRWLKLLMFAVGILLTCFDLLSFTLPETNQWFAFIAVAFIALYNGKRGKYKMKYFFYIFYPTHLVAIYAVAMLVSALM